MANLHTELPPNEQGRKGERELAEQLVSLGDDKLHLWFGLNFLPGVRDIDTLIWHEDEGIFVVEVKAVRLDAIKSFSHQKCVIQGRGSGISPQTQAYKAYESLREYLGHDFLKKMGYVTSTACWPRISRRDWDFRIDNPRLRDAFAERMIFKEDLGGSVGFSERLRYIYRCPPVRGGAKHRFLHKDANLQAFKNELAPEARLKPAESDIQRLRRIEQEVRADALKDVPTDQTTRLVYYGYPGTGKTFRLLGIALQHAIAGRRVLFACYNKVLAADLRRLMSFSDKLRSAAGELEIRDVYELLGQFTRRYGVKNFGEHDDIDKWGESVADEITRSPDTQYYDTVLVDEAQDMRDWALEMLEHLGEPGATMCIAAGNGQELYGTSSEWLRTFRSNNQEKGLRRNFRNTKPVFRIAQTFYETKLNERKVAVSQSKFKYPAQEEAPVLFEREDGIPTLLYYFNDADLDEHDADSVAFEEAQREVMVRSYRRVIKEQLDEMAEARGGGELDEYPVDLLILVPSHGSQEQRWAVEALETLPDGTEYIDLTRDDNRRRIARRDEVRLCTFHSARGIEGTRVVALGFECIQELAEKSSTDFVNLGYIVLSRSLFDTLTAFRRSRRTWPVPVFIERVLEEMRAEEASLPSA